MVAFFNSFFNYIVLLVVFVAASALGVTLGKFARKKKDNSVTKEELGTEK